MALDPAPVLAHDAGTPVRGILHVISSPPVSGTMQFPLKANDLFSDFPLFGIMKARIIETIESKIPVIKVLLHFCFIIEI